ncbi:MAG: hypothetical protein JF585_04040 [Burkholderiales bacterium]|nr:hypothetical protein [Burkholderiales bacterium]
MPAILTSLRADAIRLTHDDVAYEPLVDDASLGALLFALDLLERDAFDVPAMRYADRMTLGPALESARQYGLVLKHHVDRTDRASPRLPAAVKTAHAHAWVHAAALAVPESERDRFCWRLARRLGTDPWCDGRPAIALANQQFGMFEEGFAEMEAREAAAAASAEADRPVLPDGARETVPVDAAMDGPLVVRGDAPHGGGDADPRR